MRAKSLLELSWRVKSAQYLRLKQTPNVSAAATLHSTIDWLQYSVSITCRCMKSLDDMSLLRLLQRWVGSELSYLRDSTDFLLIRIPIQQLKETAFSTLLASFSFVSKQDNDAVAVHTNLAVIKGEFVPMPMRDYSSSTPSRGFGELLELVLCSS